MISWLININILLRSIDVVVLSAFYVDTRCTSPCQDVCYHISLETHSFLLPRQPLNTNILWSLQCLTFSSRPKGNGDQENQTDFLLSFVRNSLSGKLPTNSCLIPVVCLKGYQWRTHILRGCSCVFYNLR